ncbi:XRE family transcriptional regulator [Enterococcus faecalis]|uniref:helix-turn-helix domain-containing protein n=1 Tax=Enterococcus faecalis TaxID=1351 RepID=UPI0001B6FF0F|nr:helix-turn-helix transcriptional regulator [Enterococcus faecalis]AUC57493.1 XRE family transcriptional regulator [Enterococcus faecalis ARO1/DG]EEU87139.1 predicted protein [Enterococcus faecalis ARO1/DG]NGG33934.1 helix-turn-helix transcriptional regulator [Enterococcus faecalis]TKL72263.1 XRE family transcriptional regulator [Enterococcus faecalis]TKM53852.1 XRE family transcriptional regulator [Enterococcus faecalis]
MKEKAINELVKEVRIDSGLKQKDSRKNVMGAAAYSRIENGKKELTVNELIGVLDNLQISLFEFVSSYVEPKISQSIRKKFRDLFYDLPSENSQNEIFMIYDNLEKRYPDLATDELGVYFDIKAIFHQRFPKKINPITKKQLKDVLHKVERKSRMKYFDEDYRLISQTVMDMDKEDMRRILDNIFGERTIVPFSSFFV